MNSSIVVQTGRFVQIIGKRFLSISPQLLVKNDEVIEPPENLELAQLNYEKRRNDSIETKKARLVYQSRKRGMLENDLLLSTFAAKYLTEMTAKQVDEYDLIINLPSNDWDLYYWAMGKKPTPPEFNNSVMEMLKLHVKNLDREPRRQPTMEQM